MDILVQPFHRVIRVVPGANLLEALRAAQIPMSYSCLSGRCGTCRCRVLDGDVLDGGWQQQRPLDGLDGAVLACQTFLTGPCTIEVPALGEAVVHPARTVRATVAAIEPLARDAVRLLLRPVRPLAFSPGQYAQIAVAPQQARPYSMAGLATDALLEFHVQRLPQGRVSSHIAHGLRPGDTVKVTGPLGAAYLRPQQGAPMLCVASGTGLGPILSVIRGAVAAGLSDPIHLYLGVRSADALYGMDAIAELQQAHPALKVQVLIGSGPMPAALAAPAAPQGSVALRRGLVTQAILQDHASLRGWRAYLRGSPPMVETAMLVLRGLGLEAAHLHADAFYAQSE